MSKRIRILQQSLSGRTAAFAAASVALVVAGVFSLIGGGEVIRPNPADFSGNMEIGTFASEEEFLAYLAESDSLYKSGVNWGFSGMGIALPVSQMDSFDMRETGVFASAEGGPQRFSGTNVQVVGIDEPDIVKTDGITIFYAQERQYYYGPFVIDIEMGVIPPMQDGGTKIIGAFPPVNMSVIGEIGEAGDLLLYNDILAVFTYEGIYGYDVSNTQYPVLEWQIDLGDNTYVVTARLHQGKIYLVTQTYIDSYNPGPIRPLAVKGVPVEIDYSNIYYPVSPVPVDVTFNAMVFDAETGGMENSLSFLGSAYSSVVYMSADSIYIAYPYGADIVPYMFDFYTEACRDILPGALVERIERLAEYDISDRAKLTEIEVIIEEYLYSLSGDERMRVENALIGALQKYYDEHKRSLERTGIVKIGIDGFAISAAGSVPGTLLNQFSMDEYNGYLRMATTVGEGFSPFFWMFWLSGESANDVYVLDGDLQVVGAVPDLGLTERIYSARFVGDKGYLVTFRQIDPFYVLDLSDPQNPQLKGELKIPGYSSYLHPITDDLILGIGQEDWKVKLSLFDVGSPQNPIELDKYILDDYWSEVLSTHHAFLMDSEHGIFFLPGSSGGYIFSYADNNLELVKTVSDIYAQRALYIDDYLYIIGDGKMVVYDELSWEMVSEINF